MDYNIEIEYVSAGPISATESTDQRFVVIDFASLKDHTKALRLAFPADGLKNLASALAQVQAALEDPESGIRLPPMH